MTGAMAAFAFVRERQGYIFPRCFAFGDFEHAFVRMGFSVRIADRLVLTMARLIALAFAVVGESQGPAFLARLTSRDFEGAIVEARVSVGITNWFILILARTTATLAAVGDSQLLTSLSRLAFGNFKHTFIGVSRLFRITNRHSAYLAPTMTLAFAAVRKAQRGLLSFFRLTFGNFKGALVYVRIFI